LDALSDPPQPTSVMASAPQMPSSLSTRGRWERERTPGHKGDGGLGACIASISLLGERSVGVVGRRSHADPRTCVGCLGGATRTLFVCSRDLHWRWCSVLVRCSVSWRYQLNYWLNYLHLYCPAVSRDP